MNDNIYGISVIICAYTEERWFEVLAAVESIQQQSLPAREIILVIDHNPSMYERIRTQVSGVIVIENHRPKGASGARNSGLTLAQGELIAFLDDDAIAEPDWLERLSNGCRNPKVLGTGGVVEPLWVGKIPAWFPREFYWVVGCSYQEPFHVITEVRNPYGGCTCIWREVFDVVGGFTEGIGRVGKHPLGGEETELCIRAAQHWPEKVFLCDPQARIHHHVSMARATWRYFLARCYFEGQSKAQISKLRGTKAGLASERFYVFHTLPGGVARGLADGIFKLDPAGFLRAEAIIGGLITTTVGYLMGRICWHQSRIAHKEPQISTNQKVKDSLQLKIN
jgi:glycosyltransferase involved in cell wall biosynthesis